MIETINKMSILLILLINGILIGYKNDFLNEKFENFISKYNKTYRNDQKEYNKRIEIFQVY